jgi:hypothetical protein
MLMSYHALAAKRRPSFVFVSLVVCAFILIPLASIQGQTNNNNNGYYNRSVGGVSINPDGILNNATREASGQLAKLLGEGMANIPAELNTGVPMREVSLRRLEAAIDDCAKNNKPLPDAIKYLAGNEFSTSSSTPSRRTSCWSDLARAGKSTPRGTWWESPRGGR